MFRKPQHLLSAALAVALACFASSALAEDVADVEIISDGTAHAVKIALDDLAIGESRQVTASSGQPAVVTRTESGLVVEVAGKRTEVMMPGSDGDLTWIEGGDGGDNTKVIKIGRDTRITTHGDGDHKVIVLKDGEAGALHGRHVEIITEDLVGGEGELDQVRIEEMINELETQGDSGATKVIVTRRITSDSDAQD